MLHKLIKVKNGNPAQKNKKWKKLSSSTFKLPYFSQGCITRAMMRAQ